jgi:hypothetical protein
MNAYHLTCTGALFCSMQIIIAPCRPWLSSMDSRSNSRSMNIPPAHFRSVFSEFMARTQIDPPQILRGSLPASNNEAVLALGSNNRDALMLTAATRFLPVWFGSSNMARQLEVSKRGPVATLDPALKMREMSYRLATATGSNDAK